jgi:hypothetical protein
MADACGYRFDCVLVWKYHRFARLLGALVAALQEFRDVGVGFISHTQAIDTITPMGRLYDIVEHSSNKRFCESGVRGPDWMPITPKTLAAAFFP